MHLIIASATLFFALSIAMPSLALAQSSDPQGGFTIEMVGEMNRQAVTDIAAHLKHHIPRIQRALGIKVLPHFKVKVWRDADAFRQEYTEGGGQGGVTSGYINSELREIRVLDGENVAPNVVHEFVHLAMLHLNPGIAANPFWLWESVALYLDGSERPDTRQLTCVTDDRYPTIEDLDFYIGNVKIYRVGFLLAEFIVKHWGRAGLLTLIENNGDIPAAFAITRQEFSREWHSYLLANYEFGDGRIPMTESEVIADFSGNTLTQLALNQSAYLAENGDLVFGSKGGVQIEGRWQTTAANELCLVFDEGEPRCSKWFSTEGSRYLLESQADCVRQPWVLRKGDVEGFEVHR